MFVGRFLARPGLKTGQFSFLEGFLALRLETLSRFRVIAKIRPPQAICEEGGFRHERQGRRRHNHEQQGSSYVAGRFEPL